MPDPLPQDRETLRNNFGDGDKPTGFQFAELIESFINIASDEISVDADSNLDLPAGLNLKDSTNGIEGTLRFHGGQLEVFDGAAWNPVGGGGGGAFTEVGGGPDVAFDGGNVGIGTFASAPTFRLEIPLDQNTGEGERVRIGNGVVCNGQGTSANFAQFSHRDHASNANFAVRQGASGEVGLNAPSGQPIIVTHNRTLARLMVDGASGAVVIGGAAAVGTSLLQVNGDAAKTGGGQWANLSDSRLKKDVRPFRDGLAKLMKVRPVRFRYDGRLNTDPDQEEIGVIGQEMEEDFPYMVNKLDPREAKASDENLPDELRMYNGSALTYVMVNAIKELAGRVVELEKKLSETLQESARSPRPTDG